MNDADIVKLSERDSRAELDGLESQIWAAVAERAIARKGVRSVALYQTAVMALAMVGSISAGIVLASGATTTQVTYLTVPGIELMPSRLLFGSRQ
jgi:hypothetical protein